MLPIDTTGWSSKTGANVVPPFTVLNSPPVAVPTRNCDGLPGKNAISATRPPMFAGPMGRHERPRSWSDETGAAVAVCFRAAGSGGETAIEAQRIEPQARARSEFDMEAPPGAEV